jgi:hypothetical protein
MMCEPSEKILMNLRGQVYLRSLSRLRKCQDVDTPRTPFAAVDDREKTVVFGPGVHDATMIFRRKVATSLNPRLDGMGAQVYNVVFDAVEIVNRGGGLLFGMTGNPPGQRITLVGRERTVKNLECRLFLGVSGGLKYQHYQQDQHRSYHRKSP